MLLRERVAIITGSSRGVGRSIAETFAREGAQIVLNARQPSIKQLEAVARDVESLGVDALIVAGDVGQAQTAEQLCHQAFERFGKIDILVNNAGVSPMASICEITEEEWDEVIRINLKSAFLCSKVVFAHMKKQRSGVILNISSGSGRSGGMGAHYAASKGGMNTFTKSLAFEGAPFGIRANAISPGPIETETTETVFNDEHRRFFSSIIPLARLGDSQDIADAALFLCSDKASFITGEILELDGGLLFYIPPLYSSANRT